MCAHSAKSRQHWIHAASSNYAQRCDVTALSDPVSCKYAALSSLAEHPHTAPRAIVSSRCSSFRIYRAREKHPVLTQLPLSHILFPLQAAPPTQPTASIPRPWAMRAERPPAGPSLGPGVARAFSLTNRLNTVNSDPILTQLSLSHILFPLQAARRTPATASIPRPWTMRAE